MKTNADVLAGIKADYEGGMSRDSVARKWGVSRDTVTRNAGVVLYRAPPNWKAAGEDDWMPKHVRKCWESNADFVDAIGAERFDSPGRIVVPKSGS